MSVKQLSGVHNFV